MLKGLKDLIATQLSMSEKVIVEYPWHDAKAYGMWLAQTYNLVCHSTRLVALAGAYAPLDQGSLHARHVDHAKEERGHEKVCLADIKALGFELKDFPQTYQSSCIYQVQYYWVQHRGAASMFGYTLALECLAEHYGPKIGALVYKAHGPNATKFLRLHSEDDVEHTQSTYDQIEKLSAPEVKMIEENLILSNEIYRGMMRDCTAWAMNANIKKVA